MDFDHKIYIETEDERDYWECSCGRSGSTTEGRGDWAAEKHLQPEDSWSYVSRRP